MDTDAVIELKGVVKNFPGVRALKGIDFTIYKNEIIGLVGENGAGKSTLMKILIGLHRIDGGTMTVRGEQLQFKDPDDAVRHGVGMVFQEQSLLPNLTVAENIVLCHEQGFKRGGLISNREVQRQAEAQLKKCGFEINAGAYVRDISQAERQLVEIARLLWLSSLYGVSQPVLILDEPTTVLVQSEIDQLFELLRCMENDASIIFISHRLEEVVDISDRIVIFKDGEHVKDLRAEEADIETIENLMVGHELAEDHYKESEQIEAEAEDVLSVRDLSLDGSFEPVSFDVHKGEILCLGGVLGSGKEDLCRCLSGLQTQSSGEFSMNGKPVDKHSPAASIAAGIGYVPSDRRDEGLGLQLSVKENTSLVKLKALLRKGLLLPSVERAEVDKWIKQLRIKTPSMNSFVGQLSGGNQQKVVMAKWLASDIGLLILDHPTRGVDVGAKEEIYSEIRSLARKGLAIIVMCDTMEEDIGLSNRMITMRDGKKTAEIACPADEKPAPVDVIGYMV